MTTLRYQVLSGGRKLLFKNTKNNSQIPLENYRNNFLLKKHMEKKTFKWQII
jgi:hypothetical protein